MLYKSIKKNHRWDLNSSPQVLLPIPGMGIKSYPSIILSMALLCWGRKDKTETATLYLPETVLYWNAL